MKQVLILLSLLLIPTTRCNNGGIITKTSSKPVLKVQQSSKVNTPIHKKVIPTKHVVPSKSKQIKVTMTAYSAGDPRQGTGWRTATGRHAKHPGVAVDPKVIPLGSKVYIPGYGWRLADDTGGAIKGKRVDLRLTSRGECMKFGKRRVWVRVMEKKKK